MTVIKLKESKGYFRKTLSYEFSYAYLVLVVSLC